MNGILGLGRTKAGKAMRRRRAGVLSLEGQLSESEALNFLTALKGIAPGDEAIEVLIVRIAVGGGSLGAAQSVAEGLQFLREDTGIKSIALITETALSAGYYAAVACDHVVATPAALLGGMGSIVRTFAIGEALARLGIQYSAVTSGLHKDSLFIARPRTPEQEAVLQRIVDECAGQFLDYVVDRRRVALKSIADLNSGQVITGQSAFALGLVDEIGGFFSAIGAAARMIDSPSISIKVLDEAPGSGPSRNGPLELIQGLARHLFGAG